MSHGSHNIDILQGILEFSTFFDFYDLFLNDFYKIWVDKFCLIKVKVKLKFIYQSTF